MKVYGNNWIDESVLMVHAINNNKKELAIALMPHVNRCRFEQVESAMESAMFSPFSFDDFKKFAFSELFIFVKETRKEGEWGNNDGDYEEKVTIELLPIEEAIVKKSGIYESCNSYSKYEFSTIFYPKDAPKNTPPIWRENCLLDYRELL